MKNSTKYNHRKTYIILENPFSLNLESVTIVSEKIKMVDFIIDLC